MEFDKKLAQQKMGVTGGNFGVDRNSDPFFGNSEESLSQKGQKSGTLEDQNEQPFAPVEEAKESKKDEELVVARKLTQKMGL